MSLLDSLVSTLANTLSADTEISSEFGKRYYSDPVGWARDCIIWPANHSLSSYQEDALRDLVTYRRVCVRGPHGLGKTALFAIAVLWFATTRDALGIDWKVPSTASVWRQLEKFLWPEIHKWVHRMRWVALQRGPFTENELLRISLKLSYGEAFAIASDNPETMEGAHASEILYIFDEAKIVPDPTWDSVEGAFSTGNAYWLAGSTPGAPSGRFYDIQSRKAGYEDWRAIHVDLETAIAARRISRDWADQRRRQWGENSAIFKNRVLGEFAAQEADSMIPLSWVEAANTRWFQVVDSGKLPPFTCVGADIARYGEDKTVLAPRYDFFMDRLKYFEKQDTMTTTGWIVAELSKGGYAIVDVIGMGGGVVDRLRELGKRVIAFNASESSDARDVSGELGFVNSRSAAWWNLRELLNPDNNPKLCLPPDDLLTGDLTAPHWKMTSSGKIQLEEKDDIKARLGRSTDAGDAVVQAFFRPSAAVPTDEELLAYGQGLALPVPKDLQEYAKHSVQLNVPQEMRDYGQTTADHMSDALLRKQRGG